MKAHAESHRFQIKRLRKGRHYLPPSALAIVSPIIWLPRAAARWQGGHIGLWSSAGNAQQAADLHQTQSLTRTDCSVGVPQVGAGGHPQVQRDGELRAKAYSDLRAAARPLAGAFARNDIAPSFGRFFNTAVAASFKTRDFCQSWSRAD
ncbi:hypothetical protein ACQ5SK_00270 [Bradyrhizobium japonicum]